MGQGGRGANSGMKPFPPQKGNKDIQWSNEMRVKALVRGRSHPAVLLCGHKIGTLLTLSSTTAGLFCF